MTCSRCRADNPAGHRFCSSCGHPLLSGCPVCGEAAEPDHAFCAACGHSLRDAGRSAIHFSPRAYTPRHLAERILSSRPVTEGERKQVTVLFADLKDSLALLAARDPEEARALLDPLLECMMAAVHQYEGIVNQVMGDGIMALFGAPLALEDHAVRAAYAALRMQEYVRACAAQLLEARGAAIGIRVGLNSGEVVVRSVASDLHMDYTAVGQTTHLAARMEQAASPGSILVTAGTAALIDGYVVLNSLGATWVKGIESPVTVFEITGAGQARSRLQVAAARGLTPFVGRTIEMDRLVDALEQARAGRGQIVAVVGEAGVGKSRLLWEFLHSDRTQSCRLLESQAASHAKVTSYAPVIDLLRAYFEVQEKDDQQEIRSRVANRLLALDDSFRLFVPAFLALLDVAFDDPDWNDLDPQLRRARVMEGIRRLFVRESQQQPIVLAFEDLHWIDFETHAVLDAMIEVLPGARILLLVSYRPEYEHSWSGKSFYTHLGVDPLSPTTAQELLRTLLGDDPSLESLKGLLREQTAGNPLFLEESVTALVETEALTGTRGSYRLARSLPTIQIPASVHALLAARIDRMAQEDKQLLQSAAVIGKDVPLALLEAIAGLSKENLGRRLARLQAAEFLYESRLFPSREYTFKHALTHEVAYRSLLKDRRRTLHARIVDAIEALYRERLLEHVERLAYHARQSERWPEAVAYLRQAGAKAVARSANREAVVCFDQALEALRHLPEKRDAIEQAFDIHLDLRSALVPLGEFQRVFQVSHESESLAEGLGDRRRQGLIAALMAAVHYAMGQPEKAAEYGERALEIANEQEDTTINVLANTYLGSAYFSLGAYRCSIERTRRVVTLLPRERSSESFGVAIRPAVFARGFLCWSLAELGHFAEAEASAHEALQLAEAIEHPQTVVAGLLAVGIFYVKRGDVERAVAPFERARALCYRHDIPLWRPVFSSFLGYSLALSGRCAEAEALLREAIHQSTFMRMGVFYSQMIMWLGEAQLLAGAVAEAAELADQALASTRDRKERGLEAWARWLVAEVATHHEPAAFPHAEDLYGQAMVLASTLGLRPLVARCHLGLGTLHRRVGVHPDARVHLTTAASLFRDMEMRLWPERAEAELHMLPD